MSVEGMYHCRFQIFLKINHMLAHLIKMLISLHEQHKLIDVVTKQICNELLFLCSCILVSEMKSYEYHRRKY